MGIILSILSYVKKIYTNLISMKQKATSPSFNQDTDSNEAIRDKIDMLSVVSQR